MRNSSCLEPGDRLPGWEDRLAGIVSAARLKPYVIGEHDCFRVATAVVQALTGQDLWAPWSGKYRSKTAALKRIAAFAGDFTAAASKLFAVEPRAMAFARRGDVCEFFFNDEQHLGIVVGLNVVVLGEQGLIQVPRTDCKHFWAIGWRP